MFLLRIIQYGLGYVRFRVDRGSPERFLNLVSREGIALWNIRSKEGVLHASILSRNYHKLHPLAVSAGVVLTREMQKGLPVQTKRFARHAGILVGLLLFMALVWFFSSFVWEIDVAGNQSVSSTQVEHVLAELGLRPGAFSRFLQVRYIQNGLLLRMPELSGVTINLHGSTAYVRVRERRYPPEIVPQAFPCNVKSAREGEIIQMNTYAGKPMVQTGEAVTTGQLLISGVIEDKDGALRLVHARGTVIARTVRDLSVTIPFHDTVRTETGRTIKRYTVNLFDYGIPLYFGALQGDYDRFSYTDPAEIFGVRLPLSVTTRVYRECKPLSVTYSTAQAAAAAKTEMAQKEKVELSGVRILSRASEVKTDVNAYTLTMHDVCEEDIAIGEAIQIS